MSHHLAAPLFDSDGREEQQHDSNSFFTCGPRARSRHAVPSRVSSLALALLSFRGISLQPGDRVAILASPPRVSDDESETAEEERRRTGLDASASSSSALASGSRLPPPPRSAPLFPADAALEALLAAAAAGAVACPLNGRLPADSLAGLLSSLRPRVLFAPRGGGNGRGCEEAVAAALAAAAASRERGGGGGGHSSGDGDEGEEAFFGLPRGPEAPVVVWLDSDDDDDESVSLPSSLLPPLVAQVSLAALLSHGAGEKNSPLSSSPFAPKFAPGDAAAIVFTSGTTDPSGRPRGALLSHSALHFQSQVKMRRMRLSPKDSVLHAAPLFHVAGLSAAGAALLSRCRRNVLLEAGGWTRKGGWRAAVAGEVTALSAVSAMVFDLAAENEAELLRRRRGRGGEEKSPPQHHQRPPPLSSVRVVLVGGGAPPPARLLAAAFPGPGVRVLTAYGLTEAASSVLWGEVEGVGVGVGGGGASMNSSSSPAGIEVAVAVFEEESGNGSSSSSSSSPSSLSWRPARAGEEGELLTRGPHVFRGYWRDAAATRAAFLPAASSCSDSTTAKALLPWLRTRDAAARLGEETASIRILGRGTDAIRVGGETVHASSAEAALLKSLTSTSGGGGGAAASKAALSGVVLVGLPHPRLGQVVAALVALNSGITWRGDVVVAAASEEEQGRRPPPPPPPPSAGCGTPLSLSTLRAAARAAGLPGHALPRHAVATWASLPTKGPLAKLDRAEALRLVERAVLAGEEEEVDDDEPRPRL